TKLVVRGAAGSMDTGFGDQHGFAVLPADHGTDLRIIGIGDNRTLVGSSGSGTQLFNMIDNTGKLVSIPANTTQAGTLQGLVPTATGGFASLVAATDGMHILWYSKDGALTRNLTVSAAKGPAKIAYTPAGTVFAQAQDANTVTVKRFVE